LRQHTVAAAAMQREPRSEAEAVNNGEGHVLSEFEADPVSSVEPETTATAAASVANPADIKKKKPRNPDTDAGKEKPHKRKASPKQRATRLSAPTPQPSHVAKRHRTQEAKTTREVVYKALSSGTVQDMFLRAGIMTKTARASHEARILFYSLTKTLLEASEKFTSIRRRKTVVLEDVREAHKSQVGQTFYTHKATCPADYVNHRPVRDKTRRMKHKRAKELKEVLSKTLTKNK
jgi:hypothetical protein